MKLNCETSVEELQELLEANERNRNLLLGLLENAGVDIQDYLRKSVTDEEREVDLGMPIMPSDMLLDSARKWKMIWEFLNDEITEYEESSSELRSLKRISRTAEEYEDTEKEVQSSGELINALQDVISAIQKRDRIRRGAE